MRTRNLIALVLAASALGLGGIVLTLHSVEATQPPHAHAAEVWTCPMHPDVREPAPGTCPICGMTLVKESAPATRPAADAPARAAVVLDGRRQQLIGVRTTHARRATIAPEIRAVGAVRYDETRQVEINLKVDGWIRDLYADYTGKAIRRGEPLFTLYSPELLATQTEYVLALQAHEQALDSQVPAAAEYSERLVSAAQQRLALWDVPESEIAALRRLGRARDTLTFRSPVSGFIIEKAAVQGMRVMPGQMLFRVADLSKVWVEAEVFEDDVPFVRTGARGRVTVDALPGETFEGPVTYIYPYLTEQTRTVRVRLAIPNRDGRLKPNMYATVELEGRNGEGIVIPVDALVDTGDRQIVFLADGDGYFTPRDVKAGRRIDGVVEIVSGLADGDAIASAATFFIDSESQLRSAAAAYAPASATDAPAPGGESLDVTFRTASEPRAGANTFEVTVRGPDGMPMADAAVTVGWFMPAMPSMNMPAMRGEAPLSHAGQGVYRGAGEIAMAGRWDVTVTVARAGQALGRKAFTLTAR